MKFTSFALIAAASAVKLRHMHKQPQGGPPGANEIEAWIMSELADGGTITKAEAHEAITGFAAAHGVEIPDEVWAQLEAMFDMIDTSGDGEIDGAEMQAAWEHMQAAQGPPPNVQLPSEEEMRAWVESEFAKDGDITKEEAYVAISEWADSQGITIPPPMWDALEAGFDHVDANGDGAITPDELEAVMAGAGPRGPPPQQIKLKLSTKAKIQHKVMSKVKRGGRGPPPGARQAMEDLEDWADSELADGGTITKEEAGAKLHELDTEHDLGLTEEDWEMAEAAFDAVDTSGDGELDQGEIDAAVAQFEGGPPPSEMKLKLKAVVKNKLKSKLKRGKRGPPSAEEEAVLEELEEWGSSELADGGTITKEEAGAKIHEMASQAGVELSEEDWTELEAAFDAVDTSGDGELDSAEIDAAVAQFEGGPPPSEIKLNIKAVAKLKSKLKKRKRGPPSAEEESALEDLEAWGESELADGGTITKEEAGAKIHELATEHGVELSEEDWTELEAAFDAVDTSGDGELDSAEIDAAVAQFEGGPPPSEMKLKLKAKAKLHQKVKSMVKSKLKQPTEEDIAELEAWAEGQLSEGGTITKGEAAGMIQDFADEHGVEISDEDWEALEAGFDAVDTSGDGELDAEEVEAAIAGMEGDGPPSKGGKRGRK